MGFLTRTVQDVVDKVGAKLDSIITDYTTPSYVQVVNWLDDGLLWAVKFLPTHRLTWCYSNFSFPGNSIGAALLIDSTDLMRLVRVTKFGHEATRKTNERFYWMRDRAPHVISRNNPIYTVSGQGGQVRIEFEPQTMGPADIIGIARPLMYSDESWAPDGVLSPPQEVEDLVVDYAMIQGKIQDEEPEQVAMLWAQFKERYQLESATDAIGTEGS